MCGSKTLHVLKASKGAVQEDQLFKVTSFCWPQLAGTTSGPLKSPQVSPLALPTPAVTVRAADLPVPDSKGAQEPPKLPVAEQQRGHRHTA